MINRQNENDNRKEPKNQNPGGQNINRKDMNRPEHQKNSEGNMGRSGNMGTSSSRGGTDSRQRDEEIDTNDGTTGVRENFGNQDRNRQERNR